MLLAANSGAQVCFNPDTNYHVGVYPCSITTADFNKDGILDLATANHYSNNVSILIGLSAGTFTWVANHVVNTEPLWITSADYNNDGNIDIATANESSHTTSVLFGNGAGGFAPYLNIPLRGEGSSICSGDFNGDGNIDLATTISHYDSVAIHLSDGAGNFNLRGYYSTGAAAEPDEVVTNDLNQDGILDLVVDNWNGSIAILIGTGTGAFIGPTIFHTTGIKSTCAITGDFNKDGFLDLAACNYFSNTVSFLAGNGTGNFGASVDFPIGGIKPYTLWSADFNKDGNLDLVTANETSKNVSVVLGNGHGSFGVPYVFAADSDAEQPITGDFNNDGWPDIAVANFGANKVTVLLNAPPPAITATASMYTVCAGNQVTLIGGGALTYTWTNGVSNGIAFTPTATTTYTVTGTNSKGCGNWDTVTVTVNGCTGLGLISEELNFSVYPNPANGNFIIQTNTSEKQRVQIYNYTGKLIWAQTIEEDKITVDSGNFNPGIYFVTVIRGDKIFVKKLLKN